MEDGPEEAGKDLEGDERQAENAKDQAGDGHAAFDLAARSGDLAESDRAKDRRQEAAQTAKPHEPEYEAGNRQTAHPPGRVTVTANAPGTAGNSYATTVANFAGFAWVTGTLAGGTAGAVVQPNMYPAKYSFSATTASCSDFVVYPTGTAGATGAASIVAFSNLYSGCSRAPFRRSIGPITRAAWSRLLPCPPWMAHKWCSFR